jgi:ABC-type uncharacterized transport system permease subunit
MSPRPSYFRVFLTFVRNSLIRDMMFPTNFIIESISSIGWVAMNLALYVLIFNYTNYFYGFQYSSWFYPLKLFANRFSRILPTFFFYGFFIEYKPLRFIG